MSSAARAAPTAGATVVIRDGAPLRQKKSAADTFWSGSALRRTIGVGWSRKAVRGRGDEVMRW
ncbi:hypothetical protein CF648_25140 [Burkholderia sp. 137]|nr:hypothetical protein CF649_25135 [Burkholderia sp. 136(2017)]PNX35374.1 hypothetical protein CF648_25140 [Burkholderia sp. 137]